jgi:LAO/AO transport system kinase
MKEDDVDGIRNGEALAVARALNLIDARAIQDRDKATTILNELSGKKSSEKAVRVGLTGAPGAGKSSLVDSIIGEVRNRNLTIGVVAVDPSSATTGGALLADRIRAKRGVGDSGVFFRSMAARGRLGGIASATRATVEVLASAYDWVIVETVGVGQSEIEVANLVDTLVYVAQPGAGDILQYMKAGLLELPDIFAVNKADLGAPAHRTERELKRGLTFGKASAEMWEPPVLLTSASDDTGISELVDTVELHRVAVSSEDRRRRRRQGSERFVVEELRASYGDYGISAIGGVKLLRERFFSDDQLSEFELVSRLGSLIERTLGRQND